jgi:hypothetical protein
MIPQRQRMKNQLTCLSVRPMMRDRPQAAQAMRKFKQASRAAAIDSAKSAGSMLFNHQFAKISPMPCNITNAMLIF